MIGAGSVVTKDVKSYALVIGNPAKQIGYVCKCGRRLGDDFNCLNCGAQYAINECDILFPVEK